MWGKSKPSDYTSFRTLIFGITSQSMFPDGVVYEGVSDEPKSFRADAAEVRRRDHTHKTVFVRRTVRGFVVKGKPWNIKCKKKRTSRMDKVNVRWKSADEPSGGIEPTYVTVHVPQHREG